MMDERKVLATRDSRSLVEKAATRAMKKGGPVVPVGSTVALRRRNIVGQFQPHGGVRVAAAPSHEEQTIDCPANCDS
jgi:hypothetical protein